MKPSNQSPRTAKAKLPKARMLYAHFEPPVFGGGATVHDDRHDAWCRMMSYGHGDVYPASVIPHRTSAEARAFVAFWRLSEEQQVEAVRRVLLYGVDINRTPCRDIARAILALFAKGGRR